MVKKKKRSDELCYRRILRKSFHLNGHASGFRLQTRKLELHQLIKGLIQGGQNANQWRLTFVFPALGTFLALVACWLRVLIGLLDYCMYCDWPDTITMFCKCCYAAAPWCNYTECYILFAAF